MGGCVRSQEWGTDAEVPAGADEQVWGVGRTERTFRKKEGQIAAL